MLDIDKLPRGALSDVREFVRDNRLASKHDGIDGHIAKMTPDEFLDAYLKWNGIIGWTDAIVTTLDMARGAAK